MINDKAILIKQITEAFKDVLLDGGIGLSEADAIDAYKEESFKEKCRKQDEKHNWQAISTDALNNYYCSLSFFDAKGMRFHLPAFMIGEIKEEYRFGMAFSLTHLSDYTKSQFVLFNKEQRNAVKSFLEYLSVHPNYEFERPIIQSAIQTYWSN